MANYLTVGNSGRRRRPLSPRRPNAKSDFDIPTSSSTISHSNTYGMPDSNGNPWYVSSCFWAREAFYGIYLNHPYFHCHPCSPPFPTYGRPQVSILREPRELTMLRSWIHIRMVQISERGSSQYPGLSRVLDTIYPTQFTNALHDYGHHASIKP